MTLNTKTTLWLIALFSVFLIDSLLSVSVLHELRRIDRIIADDIEVNLNARRVRTRLLKFHSYSLATAISGDAADKQQREKFRRELLEQLEKGLGRGAPAELHRDFERLESLVAQLPNIGTRAPAGQEFGLAELLKPTNRALHDEALNIIDQIIDESTRVVTAEMQFDTDYYARMNRALLLVFFISVLILLSGLFAFRKIVLLPLTQLAAVMERIRNGNWEARWSGRRNDEIGRMGQTLNLMVQEIESRRRDRVTFIESVVHDLKNPLAAMSMTCDLLLAQRERLSADAIEKTANLIKVQVSRLQRLTQDLLENAHREQSKWDLRLRPIAAERLVRNTVTALQPGLTQHSLRVFVHAPPPLINADEDRLAQALMNLISNAAKYSAPGTPVEVHVGSHSLGLYIEVRDRGVGISDSEKAKLFVPYRRLKSGEKMAGGMGLGLSIVKEVVDAHGGTVSVHDRNGGGSIFRIILPFNPATSPVTKLAG